jgi:ribonuclease HI
MSRLSRKASWFSSKPQLYKSKADVSKGGRCEGVVFYFEGKKNIEFPWRLWHITNNHAEALAVYMGMHLIPESTSYRLIVIGDSDLIVKGLQRLIKNHHFHLMRIYNKIRTLEKKFTSVI